MSGFSPEWLALREPADIAARSQSVTRFVAGALASACPLRVVDLGSGTGSNVRYLSVRLPAEQDWRLVDHAAALLERARSLMDTPFDSHVTDLRMLTPAIFDGRDLVTASALLDLVSDGWLRAFIGHCRRVGAAVLVVLNYDGRTVCSPPDHDDALVLDLVNRHQRTDKGLGPALGPDAGRRAEAELRGAGYDVVRETSDWVVGPDQPELQRQLIAGWASAAIELSPSDAGRVRAWEARRLAHVTDGHSIVTVGHDDVGGVLR